jgi:hypothetical protein
MILVLMAKNLGGNLCYCDGKVKAYTGAGLEPKTRGKYGPEKFKGDGHGQDCIRNRRHRLCWAEPD